MTLEDAIKIQVINNDHNPNYTDAERREAHQLGIEALKRVQHLRCFWGKGLNLKLPGETKE